MCRTEIMEKTEYVESMKHVPNPDSRESDHIRRFVPPAAPPSAPPSAPPPPTAAAHMYAYTFTEPVDPELSYHAQDDEDPEEEALYQYQVQATAHQSDTIINSDIYIDRNPATLDLSSANIDECLEWWLTMTPSSRTTPTPTSSMLTSILIPAPNMIQSLGIYTQQYNTNANANMIP